MWSVPSLVKGHHSVRCPNRVGRTTVQSLARIASWPKLRGEFEPRVGDTKTMLASVLKPDQGANGLISAFLEMLPRRGTPGALIEPAAYVVAGSLSTQFGRCCRKWYGLRPSGC
jgi:hypothetical protein